VFGNDKKARSTQSALEQAQAPQESGFVGGKAMAMVEKLLDVGIDGRGPFDSATEVAAKALAKEPDPERAVDAIVKSHLKLAMANGFVTSLGGFITMPVALPANVLEFYLVGTRMVAAIAHLRGYDVDDPQIRSAILLTLVGADADDLLRKAGSVAGVSLGTSGRLTALAAQRLPRPALMVLNKAIGFRLVARAGRSVLARFGKAVPVVGGAVGAGLDVYLLGRIAANAKREFPRRAS